MGILSKFYYIILVSSIVCCCSNGLDAMVVQVY